MYTKFKKIVSGIILATIVVSYMPPPSSVVMRNKNEPTADASIMQPMCITGRADKSDRED